MSFYLYDVIFLVIFILAVGIFLYKNKKRLKWEKPLLLYRTKMGIKIIDYFSKKYKKQLKFLSYVVIIVGYILMILMVYTLIKVVYIYFKFPAVIKAIKIPPLMPLVPYITEIFNVENILPPFYFTYWIIAIAIVAICHEFMHGIFARYGNIKVKSTGFGFLGPFIAAFVEPDEKQMKKKSKLTQLSVLCAGTFANVILAIIFILVMGLFFILAFTPAGASFDSYAYSTVNVGLINSVNNKTIENPNTKSILDMLDETSNKNETDTSKYMEIKADNSSYLISEKSLIKQLNLTASRNDGGDNEIVLLYYDAPAIRNNLTGIIIEFDNIKIKNGKQFREVLLNYSPEDNVIIKTKIGNVTKSYNITLGKNPENNSRAFLGTGVNTMIIKNERGILGKIINILSFVKEPSTYYEPKISGLSIFIYNLLWWIFFINLGVALFNMLPLGIFDGGQVFYLTMLKITKSEKKAKKIFAIMTYLIILIFILLMTQYFISFR